MTPPATQPDSTPAHVPQGLVHDDFLSHLRQDLTHRLEVKASAGDLGRLDIFLKHEAKINWAAGNRPHQTWQYIHARYNPETFDEYWEEWGNKQNDAVGAILFALGILAEKGHNVVHSEDDHRIVGRLIEYLASIEYWHDKDNGVWEEYPRPGGPAGHALAEGPAREQANGNDGQRRGQCIERKQRQS